ncbi:mechanosensitive ion channel family protein [Microvirga terricola]|uniref:Mechanosensitive ion channel family protein n=1 Tax=Microvirga terricola TaxID=2719797 RepID=A0ABX0VBP9_9HYPH|nr:mechanosensitive ion channel family protein [Microvirga terricola]NIX76400.1 mechanosensitive ion channel family protein [Microvirga terricola]
MKRFGSSVAVALAVFPTFGGKAMAQEDASALVAASEQIAEKVLAHAETLRRGLDLLPDALTRTVQWIVDDRPPLRAMLFLLLFVTATILAGYALENLARRFWRSRDPQKVGPGRAGSLLLSLLVPLPSLVFFAFRGSPIRSTALALAVGWSLVHIIGAFLKSLVKPQSVDIARKPLRRIQLCLGVLVFSYIGLGLMRIAGSEPEPRLALVTILWVVFMGLGFAALKAFRDALPLDWGLPHERGDLIVRYIRPHWYGVSLFMLALTGVAALVASINQSGFAFVRGAASVLLLGVVLVFLFLKPDIATDETHPWRQALRRCARLAVFAGYWIGLALIWGIDPLLLASDRVSQPVARALIDIGIACAVALMLWELIRTALDSYAAPAPTAGEHGEEPGHAKASTRIQTFLPLLRAAIAIFIAVVTAMVILASFGVNIGPMLAGAGVVGIAIGFGSQTLVKDVISGLFFLADDAFRLGEYIEIGNAKGNVEKMSIRSLRLRHPRGPLYTVPFGEIRQIVNHSRDYAIVKMEFTIAFDTDLVKAKKIVKQIAAELNNDPELMQHLLQPLKFQGVRRMEQYGLVVGVKYTAKPGEQFELRREVFHRIRDAFSREGIDFARPQVVVQMPPGVDNPEVVKAAVLSTLNGGPATPEQGNKA